MNIQITQYAPLDQEAVKTVVLNGFEEFGFSYMKQYDYDLDDPEQFYITPGGMFYVLKIDGKVVGTIGVINKGNVAELKRWYVDREYQGKGLGSKLLEKAVKFCKDGGFTKVALETNKKFKKAHEMYKKRGFKLVVEDKRSYYMEKSLV